MGRSRFTLRASQCHSHEYEFRLLVVLPVLTCLRNTRCTHTAGP
jgi:hypothetical protein